ncbi:hypothetical protein JAAARDRAFT_29151 [Jaapia argillacea MUCL 33604]|uniref:F-box domain-containing protein n=1 Tax=Jaapia argillacea MUCL 33604 TaxID=933084 RepID=A0A067QAE2_9AGAM|nr:hypothetical protein JAAARDRAFT_29151 [Jaapia argillacea MUCL 33604]
MTTYLPPLPPELWLKIFLLATTSWCTRTIQYEPFDTTDYATEARLALQTKLALVLVCRSWWEISMELLYEEIWIRHGWQALQHAVDRKGSSFGRYVRCIHLSTNPAGTYGLIPAVITPDRILESCPNLRVLVKGKENTAGSHAHLTTDSYNHLRSLKRLSWCHRLGDQDLLQLTLSGTLCLETLELTAPPPAHYPRPYLPRLLITLPALTTLRLHSLDYSMMHQMRTWTLPSLTSLIAHRSPDNGVTLNAILVQHGHPLQKLEFGANLQFFMSDVIVPSLVRCPTLRELNYYLYFTSSPRVGFEFEHHSLECVRLHLKHNPIFDGHERMLWPHLQAHFEFFVGPALPSLDRIILHGGNWDTLIRDVAFRDMLEQIRSREISLETPDGSMVEIDT